MTKEFDPGDLRAVEGHVARLLAGEEDATGEIISFGRDAAGLLARLAEEKKNEALKVLAKRLVAVPPQVPTNIMALREEAVKTLVSDALEKPMNATDLRGLVIAAPQFVLFDPLCVLGALVKGGKPRRDPLRVGAGDVVWFGAMPEGASGAPTLAVTLTTAPVAEGQPAADARLRVESGIVFVGPPEAADGPRLGEVRLDPFRTNLHVFLTKGRFVRLKPGVWKASAHQAAGGAVTVHLCTDPDPAGGAPAADLGALAMLPFTVSSR